MLTCIAIWAMRCRVRSASKHREFGWTLQEKELTVIAWLNVLGQSSSTRPAAIPSVLPVFGDPRPNVAASRALRCSETLNSPWSKTHFAYGEQADGTGVLLTSLFRTARKFSGLGCDSCLLSKIWRSLHSQTSSLQGNCTRTSLIDSAGEWPNIDACCASMMNAKNAVRLEDSAAIQWTRGPFKGVAVRLSRLVPEACETLPRRISVIIASCIMWATAWCLRVENIFP
jgi:hypothetical protein